MQISTCRDLCNFKLKRNGAFQGDVSAMVLDRIFPLCSVRPLHIDGTRFILI